MKKRAMGMAAGIVVVVVTASMLRADGEPERKEAKIRELMKLTGAADMGKQTMDAMLESFRATPNISPEFIERFKKEVDPDEIVELIIPIYDKYLTEQDLDAVIAFYKTPAGRKFISVLPQMLKESLAVGQQWGQQKALHVLKLIEDEKKKKDSD